MAKPILVGYDEKAGDRAPVEFGVAAAKLTGASLIVGAVHASAAGLGVAGERAVEEQLPDGPAVSLDHLATQLRQQGVRAECRALPGTSAPRALHEAAEEFGAGLLVLGSTDRGGLGRVLPGSTAQRLLHGAPCPVAVVPRGWERGGGLKTIGVAYAETPEGRRALDDGIALVRRSGAKLRVLHAGKPHGLSDEEAASALRVRAEQAVEAATSGQAGVDVESVVSVGDPAEVLIAASEHLDLLICGSRGYGSTRAVLLGGVSRRVTTEARCPVIALARGAEFGLEALIGEREEATA